MLHYDLLAPGAEQRVTPRVLSRTASPRSTLEMIRRQTGDNKVQVGLNWTQKTSQCSASGPLDKTCNCLNNRLKSNQIWVEGRRLRHGDCDMTEARSNINLLSIVQGFGKLLKFLALLGPDPVPAEMFAGAKHASEAGDAGMLGGHVVLPRRLARKSTLEALPAGSKMPLQAGREQSSPLLKQHLVDQYMLDPHTLSRLTKPFSVVIGMQALSRFQLHDVCPPWVNSLAPWE